MVKRVACVFLLGYVFGFCADFVIGAYGLDSIHLFSNAHDSLRLNTVVYGWPWNSDSALSALSTAENESLKVILGSAPPAGTPLGRRLGWYGDLWHKLWESEDNIYFDHEIGTKVYDDAALNDTAWYCDTASWGVGLMQTGKEGQWQLRIPTNDNDTLDSILYTARFRLKIDIYDTTSMVEVCKLVVLGPDADPDSTFDSLVLRIKDFPGANVYRTCDLQFRKKPGSNDEIFYQIYWFDNVNLWADNVEVKDCYVDSLTSQLYNGRLTDIAQLYSQYNSLLRFYLRDEPRYGHFPSNAYLMRFLADEITYQKGIQALPASGESFFQSYADSIRPEELIFSDYVFFGRHWPGGRTPEDAGSFFQERLDSLCSQLADIRTVAISETLDFWYIPQSFGKYNAATAYSPDSGGNEGDWRLPTLRELRCGVWLGLAYGAKGGRERGQTWKLETISAARRNWIPRSSRGMTKEDTKVSSIRSAHSTTLDQQILCDECEDQCTLLTYPSPRIYYEGRG